jgi:hypothetical protein
MSFFALKTTVDRVYVYKNQMQNNNEQRRWCNG